MKNKILVAFAGTIILLALFFYLYSNNGYCSIDEIFNDDKFSNPTDKCRKELIKLADNGNRGAEIRLMKSSTKYYEKICKIGIDNLDEREKYYVLKYGKNNPFCKFDENLKDSK